MTPRALASSDAIVVPQGNETRARMIQAAIEVFGALGYDGASTRTLASKAGVNQAAIPYHFGGKRELYLAAARAIADYTRDRLDPVITRLSERGGDPAVRIGAALGDFFHLLIGGDEPDAWTDFFVRCERDGDEAFGLIYHEAVCRFQHALITSIADATHVDADDASLKMRIAIVLASFANLRTLRNFTLSTLGWDRLDAARLAELEETMTRFALRELLGNHPLAAPREPTADTEARRPASA